ncbi:hypothetical protein M5K25_022806 [Dendrobium thyrsiflorum]|uniref:Uncharacterized protein n=1 Tax=Dendrobium thyrsiflorum TaxID=117978 RepID=A0ABD0UDI4_DENTH
MEPPPIVGQRQLPEPLCLLRTIIEQPLAVVSFQKIVVDHRNTLSTTERERSTMALQTLALWCSRPRRCGAVRQAGEGELSAGALETWRRGLHLLVVQKNYNKFNLRDLKLSVTRPSLRGAPQQMLDQFCFLGDLRKFLALLGTILETDPITMKLCLKVISKAFGGKREEKNMSSQKTLHSCIAVSPPHVLAASPSVMENY